MAVLHEQHERAGHIDDDWLARCEGFQVDGTGGRLGVVEEVRWGPDGEVHALVVVGGLLGNRHLLVPVSEIAVVQPRRMRVALIEASANARLVAGDTPQMQAE